MPGVELLVAEWDWECHQGATDKIESIIREPFPNCLLFSIGDNIGRELNKHSKCGNTVSVSGYNGCEKL